MGYYEENRKLYPLKAGDVLECVESDGVDFFKKGFNYLAMGSGIILDGDGDPWFERAGDVPYSVLFKLKSSTPEWTEGQPPEELPEGKQVVVGYKLVDKPVLEVGKVYADAVGCKWKAVYDNGEGLLMTSEGRPTAYLWTYDGKPIWFKHKDYIIDFSVPPQDDY